MIDRKKWLEEKIDYYSGLDVLGQLTPDERVWLESYQQVYQQILDKEHEQERAIKADKSKEMRLRRRRGKETERKLAKDIGGKRRAGVGQEDIDAGLFSIEAKHVKKFMSRMEKGLSEAFAHKGSEQIAIYVEKCGREARFYGDWRDFIDLHGKPKGKNRSNIGNRGQEIPKEEL